MESPSQNLHTESVNEDMIKSNKTSSLNQNTPPNMDRPEVNQSHRINRSLILKRIQGDIQMKFPEFKIENYLTNHNAKQHQQQILSTKSHKPIILQKEDRIYLKQLKQKDLLKQMQLQSSIPMRLVIDSPFESSSTRIRKQSQIIKYKLTENLDLKQIIKDRLNKKSQLQVQKYINQDNLQSIYKKVFSYKHGKIILQKNDILKRERAKSNIDNARSILNQHYRQKFQDQQEFQMDELVSLGQNLNKEKNMNIIANQLPQIQRVSQYKKIIESRRNISLDLNPSQKIRGIFEQLKKFDRETFITIAKTDRLMQSNGYEKLKILLKQKENQLNRSFEIYQPSVDIIEN